MNSSHHNFLCIMPDKDLQGKLAEKIAYFREQDLLDISDDEKEIPEEDHQIMEHVLMPSARLVRRSSSFLGPTPKERLAEFEAYSSRHRATARPDLSLARSATAPDIGTTHSFSRTKPRQRPTSSPKPRCEKKFKHGIPLPELCAQGANPFYMRMGVAPRELKNGKNVKPADTIKLDPKDKQLLRGKVVYFFPNDDVSMVRRRRIHKLIQLGAAWSKTWRDDITYIMVDDDNHTYMQVLRNINMARLPVGVCLTNNDTLLLMLDSERFP